LQRGDLDASVRHRTPLASQVTHKLNDRGNRALVAGRYELFEPLGSGGAGTVFRARVAATGQEVALKLVPPGDDTQASYARVAELAPRLAGLHDPRLVPPLDFGRDETGGLYVASELVRGEPLGRELVTVEDMSPVELARVFLSGLASAHAAGFAHLDLKPSNVLVGGTEHEIFILDFGVAPATRRVEIDQAIGHASAREGVVWGTPAYMAPEQLGAGEPGPASDVYAVGLMLLEVFGAGPLFDRPSLRDELRARVTEEPDLTGRVPAPLLGFFQATLARDPARRIPDARAALALLAPAVGEVATPAPTAVLPRTSSAPPSSRLPSSRAPRQDSEHPTSIRSAALGALYSDLPRTVDAASLPAIVTPPILSPDAALRITGGHRAPRLLTQLPAAPTAALGEVLGALDLPMLDALARRERGAPLGRVVRAIALATRLELDAAALLLEPLAAQHPVARAVGATLVAPVARRVTRARVDGDPADGWTRTLEIELAVTLASVAAVLGDGQGDAPRVAQRCARLLERADREGSTPASALLTLRIATACFDGLAKGTDLAGALSAVLAIQASARDEAAGALDRLLRSLAIGTLAASVEGATARSELDRARKLAQDVGATLFEVTASARLGRLLAQVSGRGDAGLRVLERATTLTAQGDSPVIEHDLEVALSAAHVVGGRAAEALSAAERAREVARAERSFELDAASVARVAIAHALAGDTRAAKKAQAELVEARLATLPPAARALGRVVRALTALPDLASASRELDDVEAILAASPAGVAAETRDLARVLRVVASGADEARVAACVEDATHAVEVDGGWGFHWIEVVRSAVAGAPALEAAIATLAGRLEPVARADRRTSIPPA